MWPSNMLPAAVMMTFRSTLNEGKKHRSGNMDVPRLLYSQ